MFLFIPVLNLDFWTFGLCTLTEPGNCHDDSFDCFDLPEDRGEDSDVCHKQALHFLTRAEYSAALELVERARMAYLDTRQGLNILENGTNCMISFITSGRRGTWTPASLTLWAPRPCACSSSGTMSRPRSLLSRSASHNSDLRDSHECIQKHVWGEQIFTRLSSRGFSKN